MTFPLLAYYGLQSLRIGEAAASSVVLLPVFGVLAVIIAVRLQKDD
jgi:multiple sugar transport system permease protein